MGEDGAFFRRNDGADLAQVLERAFGFDARMAVGVFQMRKVEADIERVALQAEDRLMLGGIEQVAGFLDGQDQRPVVLRVDQRARAPDRHQPGVLRPAPCGDPGCVLAQMRDAVERRARVPEVLQHGAKGSMGAGRAQ